MNERRKLPIIHIIGLPGAGKTTLAARLAKRLNLPIYRIGTYRARFPATPIGEADAWLALFYDLSKKSWENCILETTGLNRRESFLKCALPLLAMVTVKLKAPKAVLYERIQKKSKREQGGDWLFSEIYKDKHGFVKKLHGEFGKLPADLEIDTGSLTVKQSVTTVVDYLMEHQRLWS